MWTFVLWIYLGRISVVDDVVVCWADIKQSRKSRRNSSGWEKGAREKRKREN